MSSTSTTCAIGNSIACRGAEDRCLRHLLLLVEALHDLLLLLQRLAQLLELLLLVLQNVLVLLRLPVSTSSLHTFSRALQPLLCATEPALPSGPGLYMRTAIARVLVRTIGVLSFKTCIGMALVCVRERTPGGGGALCRRAGHACHVMQSLGCVRWRPAVPGRAKGRASAPRSVRRCLLDADCDHDVGYGSTCYDDGALHASADASGPHRRVPCALYVGCRSQGYVHTHLLPLPILT